tara:strand:+ start:2806 stop:3303 length:498 start_codon:yes stop_codon:yes gene_type:complete
MQDWYVFIGQNRDSEALTRSNFTVALRELERVDPEGEDFTTVSFSHWGPGWIELILVRPDTKAATEAQEMSDALMDYPVLDESHFSELEYEEMSEWVSQECYRLATSCLARDLIGGGETWQELDDDKFCPSLVMEKLQWYHFHECSPSDEIIIEALNDLGLLKED